MRLPKCKTFRPQRQSAMDSKVDNRADGKLQFVCEKLGLILGARGELVSNGTLSRLIYVKDVPEFSLLCLTYKKRQRLFASLYDLSIQVPLGNLEGFSSIPIDLRHGDCLISYKDGAFVASSAAYCEPASELNGKLVCDRIKQLGVFDITLTRIGRSNLVVELSQMVGSSTWNLIPPVMQLINPSDDDYVRTIELLRMTSAIAGGLC